MKDLFGTKHDSNSDEVIKDKNNDRTSILKDKIQPLLDYILVENKNLIKKAISSKLAVNGVKMALKVKVHQKIEETLKPNILTRGVITFLVDSMVDGTVDNMIARGIDALDEKSKK